MILLSASSNARSLSETDRVLSRYGQCELIMNLFMLLCAVHCSKYRI